MQMDSDPRDVPLPYWQVNIAPENRLDDCPVALQNLSDKDIGIIGTRDEDYHVQTWDEVVDIVRTSRLQDFRRWPSELRRYREFIWQLKHVWGSVLDYMLSERLHWKVPITPRSSTPFECEEDFKILFNDWPYGIDERIVHLVVWTKFELRDDAETVAEIERFIEKTFSSKVAKDKVSDDSLKLVKVWGNDTDMSIASLVHQPTTPQIYPHY